MLKDMDGHWDSATLWALISASPEEGRSQISYESLTIDGSALFVVTMSFASQMR